MFSLRLTKQNQTLKQFFENIDATLANPFLSDSIPPAGDLAISCVNRNPFTSHHVGTPPTTMSKMNWLRFE